MNAKTITGTQLATDLAGGWPNNSSGAYPVFPDERDQALHVDVRDDGVGGARPDGSGLVGLADRLAVLDGRLRVESSADGSHDPGQALNAKLVSPRMNDDALAFPCEKGAAAPVARDPSAAHGRKTVPESFLTLMTVQQSLARPDRAPQWRASSVSIASLAWVAQP